MKKILLGHELHLQEAHQLFDLDHHTHGFDLAEDGVHGGFEDLIFSVGLCKG